MTNNEFTFQQIPLTFNETDERLTKKEIKDHKIDQKNAALLIQQSNFIISMDGPYTQYYELDTDMLGRGSFGKVFKVKSKVNQEIRAMKIIQKQSNTINPDYKKEFEELKLLDHPQVLKLYHSFEDDENYYIVSELCEGGTLLDYVIQRDDACNEREICKIMWQLMSAVHLAHTRNIIHRDIKPDNILIDMIGESLQIKLIDWGLLCKLTDSEQQAHQQCGTSHYVAPEVFSKQYDSQCDIWSCGVVLFILVQGDPPFQGVGSKEIFTNIIKGDFKLNYHCWTLVSQDLKDLLSLMLVKDPKIRYNAGQVLKHPWFQNYNQSSYMPSLEIQEGLCRLSQFTKPPPKQKSKTEIQKRFAQAMMMFISAQIVHKKDKQSLQRVFQKINKNSDGQISKEELKNAFMCWWPSLESDKLDQQIEQIFELVDLNLTGSIQYSEFIAATVRLDNDMEYLKQTFDFFDAKKEGFITIDNLTKPFTGQDEIVGILIQIFDLSDSNKDRKVSYQEFYNTIKSLTQKCEETQSSTKNI